MEISAGSKSQELRAPGWMAGLVVGLFFAWGFATVLSDALIPKLKALFSLSYAEAGLTQFAFFIAYFVVSVPAGFLLARIGYLRGIVVGLAVMVAGCVLFVPAAGLAQFPIFLLALFVLASGITILQVAANPFIAMLGRPEKSHSRLTMAQTANSFGTLLAPRIGSWLILGGAGATAAVGASAEAQAKGVEAPYLIIAAAMALFAVVFWLVRKQVDVAKAENPPTFATTFALLKRPRVALGALSIFLYVGAEVAIGSFLVNYLAGSEGHPGVLPISQHAAADLLVFYWGGAFVGRFIGTFLLRVINAGRLLALFAVGAGGLVLVSIATTGQVAAVSLLAVGLFNSIMFPTIFTLAIEGLGEETAPASGLLCMAIVGGAIVPPLTGYIADQAGLGVGFLAPVACYAWILLYGLMSARPGAARAPSVAAAAPPAG